MKGDVYMFRFLSSNMRKLLIESLCERYDKINNKLQRDFLKIDYDEEEIEQMKNELKRIDETIKELKGE